MTRRSSSTRQGADSGIDSVKDLARRTFVLQRTRSESGSACLASIARYHGGSGALTSTSVPAQAASKSTSLLDLYRTAQAMGLDAAAYTADLANLKSVALPCILHVVHDGRADYVVCYGFERGRFIIGDPTAGVKEYSPSKLERIWKSRALLALAPASSVAAINVPVADERPPQRFAWFDGTFVPFGSQEIVVRSYRSNTARLLPASVAPVLHRLKRFDTLSGHVSDLIERIEGAANGASPVQIDASSVRDLIHELSSAGILESIADVEADVIRRIADRVDAVPEGAAVASICIPTADRPLCLRRAVMSHILQALHHDRDVTIRVMDDTRDLAMQRRNVEALAGLVDDYGSDVRYADRQDRREHADRLSAYAGVPNEVVQFALLGDDVGPATHGAPRNALLLETAGEMCLQADDDTTGEVMEVSEWNDGLSFSSEPESNEYWYFDSSRSAFESVTPADVYLLDLHERLLGTPLASVVAPFQAKEGMLHVEEVSRGLVERLSRPEARVAITFTGVIGDSGMSSFQQKLFKRGRTLERLVHSEEGYNRFLRSRHLLRVSRRLTVSDGHFCMGTSLGLDNRLLLPPFPPAGRNEDGVFSAVLSACVPAAFRGYVPRYAVSHLPPDERPSHRKNIAFDGMRGNDLIAHLVSSHDHSLFSQGAGALHALGDMLVRLAHLPPKPFSDYVRAVALQAVHANVLRAQQCLDESPEAPTYWRNDVLRYIALARDAATDPDIAAPSDFSGLLEDRYALFQHQILSYGRLLTHWPELIEAAQALKAGGHMLATPVRSDRRRQAKT